MNRLKTKRMILIYVRVSDYFLFYWIIAGIKCDYGLGI